MTNSQVKIKISENLCPFHETSKNFTAITKQQLSKPWLLPRMGMHAFNSNILEAAAGGSLWVQASLVFSVSSRLTKTIQRDKVSRQKQKAKPFQKQCVMWREPAGSSNFRKTDRAKISQERGCRNAMLTYQRVRILNSDLRFGTVNKTCFFY